GVARRQPRERRREHDEREHAHGHRGDREEPEERLRVHHSARSDRGTSTRRARTYSPRLFACGSLRVDLAAPSPRSPWPTKLRLWMFGSGTRSTVTFAASGTSCLKRSTVR